MARDLAIEITVETAQAEQALLRVETALQGVEQQAVPAGKSLDAIAEHAPDLRAKLDEMKASLNKTEEALKKKTVAAEKSSTSMDLLGSAVMRFAGPAAIGLAIKQTLAFAEHIENLSKQTGIAPGKLQALEFSAKQVGLSIDPVAKAIGMMSDRIASGDKSALGALDRLGLSFKTIRGMSPDAAFLEIARAVAEVEDPMDRARNATDLFGRTGIELLPLLTADIDALMKKARELGLVMDDKTTKAAADLNNQFGDLLDVGKRLIMVFFAPLMPILSTLLGLLTPVTAALGKMIDTILSPLQQLREFAELLGVIATRLPGLPKGPGATFLPGGLPTMGIPSADELEALYGGRVGRAPRGGGRRSTVLPFEPPGYEPMDAGYLAWLQQARGPMTMGIPGMGPGSFPGWAQPTPFSGQMEGGLPWAPYAGTVGMNRPNVSRGGGFMSGAGGRFLGAGLGMASSFIPGMSGQGSMIGSSFGSALGGLKGITGMMGSFAPMLGPIMGIAGGLLGKLFNGEGKQVSKDRNSFISDFGGMGELQKAADTAGFSLDKLLSTKKAAEFTAEVKKLEQAMGAFDQKVKDANADLDAMRGELDGVIARGNELGYNFNAAGELVSVSFQKMQEKAKLYGLDLAALGPTFERQRLHEAAGQIINDFDLLTRGGASIGTVLSGMSDEISKLVADSIKFGVDIPANMEPWVKELLRTHQLTDENGVAMTDLSKLKFAAPIETEFDKISKKIGELIDKIADMVTRIDEMTRPRTIDIGFNVEAPPEIPTPDYQSMGGFVQQPRYLSSGGFIPRGTDSVPAMLTPGEGVMRREAVSRLMRGDWPNGGGMNVSIDNIQVGRFDSEQEAEVQLGRALVRGMKRRGVRLNAA